MFADRSFEPLTAVPLKVQICNPGKNWVRLLRIQLDLAVQREVLEQLRLGAESKAADIPFRVFSLVRIHYRVVELEASAELQPLDHGVVLVLVPVGELPDRVERRRLLLGASSLRR